ncbi:DUF2232 domain-containing protein [Myxacorys almedinensis]|uniref:DUF2232 domain-containing protein n=1 Tax=Myxacorys almedinensis A TaxID=2690445 RepID=A0A8J7Z5U6_9CYAN|nr:DUF2232 domain-containing protein [Myxacorys almedinensis]NDJ18638.1 DUF2232 domain-containing protein [Myxacorys almedinensis A]
MSDLPNDPSTGVDPLDLDDDWIPDLEPEPAIDAPRQPLVRQVDPSSPIMMVETAFLASASSLIWLVNSYFPMGPVLQVFFPVPIAMVYLRWGNRAAWMGALVSGLLLSVLVGPPRSIQFVIPFGLLGVLLGVLWYRRVRWAVSIPISALLSVFGDFFRLWLGSILLGEDLWLYGTVQVTNLLEWIFTRLGLLLQPSLEVIQLFAFLIIVLRSVVYVSMVHLVAWYLFDRLKTPIPRPPRWVQVLFDND